MQATGIGKPSLNEIGIASNQRSRAEFHREVSDRGESQQDKDSNKKLQPGLFHESSESTFSPRRIAERELSSASALSRKPHTMALVEAEN